METFHATTKLVGDRYKIVWKIEEIHLCSHMKKIDGPIFEVNGNQWKLRFIFRNIRYRARWSSMSSSEESSNDDDENSNDDEDEQEKYYSGIHLELMTTSATEIFTVVEFEMEADDPSEKLTKKRALTFEKGSTNGVDYFAKLKKVQKCMKNNYLTITCLIHILETQTETIQQKNENWAEVVKRTGGKKAQTT